MLSAHIMDASRNGVPPHRVNDPLGQIVYLLRDVVTLAKRTATVSYHSS
jgi:hypothetical protein